MVVYLCGFRASVARPRLEHKPVSKSVTVLAAGREGGHHSPAAGGTAHGALPR